MICSAGMDGGSLVMADSVWPAMPPSTGIADPELLMPGERVEPEAEGGGRGPCCWAIAGSANAVAVQVMKRTNLAAGIWNLREIVSLVDVNILSTPILVGS